MSTPAARRPHDQLRERWLAFFGARQHALPPSASLVPDNDPTLLFTGAGMNQFKDLFLGKVPLPYRRAATVQRCLRQGDLENVGRTPRHLTFFEMLGHFSFGDYFKREAVAWAWELLVRELGFDAKRLRISVYEDDDEALQAWLALGVSRDAIARFDAKENFWPANAPKDGPNGPCGPCSEIFFDYGPSAEVGDGSAKAYDSGRFVEIWNTVFTQFDRRGVDDLAPLPQRNIDCGAGMERVLAALEAQRSPFGTSMFRPIVTRVAGLAGKPYAFDPAGGIPQAEDARRMRRISDHARAASFLVADGVKPGNEGRGYVLRRILRRAIRDGIQLGLSEPFLERVAPTVIEVMGDGYPYLHEAEAVICDELRAEELRFRETYARGVHFLSEEVSRAAGGKVLPGEAAFRLYDTYGFPLDLAEVILAEQGMTVDRAGFEREMEAQRERARAGAKMKGDIFAVSPLRELRARGVLDTRTQCHEAEGACTEGEGRIVGLLKGDALVQRLAQGDEGTVVLDQSPFYAESGGQVGDTGTLESPQGMLAVDDTQKGEGLVLHRGRVTRGALSVGDTVSARADRERRDAVRRNHTATHLLHRVLKDVLGEHVRQQGSLVAPDRLRFDFSHGKALAPEEVAEVERRLNGWVLGNHAARTEVLDLEAAKASGAVAMFGEKYDARVRVLDVPGEPTRGASSRELCGGTHVARTGDIGSFRITLETSIASGVRRIEAVTGLGAADAASRDRATLRELGDLLKARPDELATRVRAVQAQLKDLQKVIERAQAEAASREVERLLATRDMAGGLRVALAVLEGLDPKGLKGAWDRLRKDGVEVAVLVSRAGSKAPVFVGVGEAGRARGLDASALLKDACAVLGGGGGGKADQAQGQGSDPAKAEAALGAVRARLGT
ncbi:MAG: alanine--tRNA ligase [Planctomycetia bacterium]